MDGGITCSGSLPQNEDLLQKQDIVKLKRCIYAAQVSKENNVRIALPATTPPFLAVCLSVCLSF